MQKYDNKAYVRITTNKEGEVYTIIDSYVNEKPTNLKKAGVIYLLRGVVGKRKHYTEKHHDQVVLV